MQLLGRSPQALAADILVAPSVTVFNGGYRNRFGHPRAEVVRRYKVAGSQFRRSGRDGAVLFGIGLQGISVQTWREARRRYW